MPLYSDSNYYYSGGSSQLYSPYYTPGSYGNPTQTSSVPYSSTYNRSFGGSYVVPPAPPRSPTYTATHGLSSRYQPKLCTITETSPLIAGSRHTSLMPLTRIHSPKFSSYTSPSTSLSNVGARYIPPRPIAINTADLDVSSSSRYRKHKDDEKERQEAEDLEAKKKRQQAEDNSPTTSTKKRRGSNEAEQNAEADQNNNAKDAEGTERKTARSTIKRNRAVVRLSTIRSRSKDRSKSAPTANTGTEKASPENSRNKFRDLPHAPEEKVSWRQKLAEDLAAIPVYPIKKSPGDLIRERYLIQEANKEHETDNAASRRAERIAAASNTNEKALEEVVVELDAVDETIRRLSIAACPSFHDICEDISSDKIDDDLNAGALRRRASLIQEQEQDLFNQLQNSPSGTFQLIHLEREGSHDSSMDESLQRQSVNKRKSKKVKKIRHKITAIVEVENAPLTPIPQEREEDQAQAKDTAFKPKFTCNVDSVEEHHEIHKIFKLPKKKSIKKSAKEVPLPEGFVQAKPKAKRSPDTKAPKKQTFISTAEIFTFDKPSIDVKNTEMQDTQKIDAVKCSSHDVPETPIISKNIEDSGIQFETTQEPKDAEVNAEVELIKVSSQTCDQTKINEKAPIPTTSVDSAAKSISNILVKSQSLNNEEIKSPPVLTKPQSITPISKSLAEEEKDDPIQPAGILSENKEATKNQTSVLTTSVSLDMPKLTAAKPTIKVLQKSKSVNIEEIKSPLTPTKTKTLPVITKTIVEEKETQPKSEVIKTMVPAKLCSAVLTNSTSLDTPTTATPTEKSQLINVDEPKPKVATPKPIKKLVQKSDSGEDFWTQIGSRETLYMTNRKKGLLESQWQKRENLLESQTTEEVSNLEDIKTAITAQKAEALQKAKVNLKIDDKGIEHSHSSVTPLCKNSPKKSEVSRTAETKSAETKSEENKSAETKSVENVASPKSGTSPKKVLTRTKTSELLVNLAKPKTEADKAKSALTSTTASRNEITSPKQTVEISIELAKPITGVDKPKPPESTVPPTTSNPKDEKIVSQKSSLSPKKITRKKTAELLVELEKPKTDLDNLKAAPIVAPTAKTAEPSTTTSATLPKINSGQTAKSPEKQQNKLATTTAATTVANNKDKTPINNTTTAVKLTTVAAKHSELATASTTSVATKPTATTTTTTTAITAAKQQPETKAKQTATTEADKKSNAELKSAIDTPKTSDKTKLVTTKPKLAATGGNKTSKVSPTAVAAKAKTSPTAAVAPTINADQFISVAPVKALASPTKNKNASPSKTTATATSTAATTVAATKTLTDKVVKASATSTSTTTTTATIASTPTAPTTTTATTKSAAPVATTITAAASVAIESPTSDGNNNNSSSNDTQGVGNNLSKFATVSNLAQCLQDVDGDLEDYIPSSAENSDDENTSDISTDDISSANGCENLSASMKKKLKQRRKKEKLAERARFDPKKKVTIDPTNKCYVKEEAPRFPLVATPRPLWKREKIVYPSADTDDSDSDESGSTEETEDSDECTTSEEYEDELNPSGTASPATTATANSGSTASKENSSIIRMSTCSNDSGFEGGTAPSSPKKMLECDVNCHKKCERLTANMCGVNQKLIVEALAYVKRGARETRDSPSTPPSLNPAYKIETTDEHDETSYTYSQFQKSGRFTAPATVIPRFKNYTVDDFHFLTVLGKGSFGKVLLAELRETTYYYAIKCLKKDVVLEDDDVDSTLIERKVLALGTKHPYLCHLFCTFQTESHLFFVMEYLNGGDLMFHIQESGRFSEERARFYGAEIISGLKFLHKKGIIYRDLKLDNVLLDYEGHVRIADFGMCKLQIYLDKTADSFCGTPDYMAPEIIKGEKYNQNVDWWSFGVLLYEMLIGQSPFSGCDEDELFWSICNEIPWFPVYISAEATGILKGLLEKDYTKRIGSQYSPAGDLSDHIFFRPIDWNLLEKRQLEPPYRPQVKHPLDTQYFDRVFTRERVRLTPIDKEILQSIDQKQFHGFTYTNPHITLD